MTIAEHLPTPGTVQGQMVSNAKILTPMEFLFWWHEDSKDAKHKQFQSEQARERE